MFDMWLFVDKLLPTTIVVLKETNDNIKVELSMKDEKMACFLHLAGTEMSEEETFLVNTCEG